MRGILAQMPIGIAGSRAARPPAAGGPNADCLAGVRGWAAEEPQA
jgi:hypothetical protein